MKSFFDFKLNASAKILLSLLVATIALQFSSTQNAYGQRLEEPFSVRRIEISKPYPDQIRIGQPFTFEFAIEAELQNRSTSIGVFSSVAEQLTVFLNNQKIKAEVNVGDISLSNKPTQILSGGMGYTIRGSVAVILDSKDAASRGLNQPGSYSVLLFVSLPLAGQSARSNFQSLQIAPADKTMPETMSQLALWLLGSLIAALVTLFVVSQWRSYRKHNRERQLEGELKQVRHSLERISSAPADPFDTTEQTPKKHFTAEVPQQLIEACLKGACCLYAGHGMSAQAGFPTAVEALIGFLTELESIYPHRDWGLVRAELVQGNIDTVIELIETRGKRKELLTYLRSAYTQPISQGFAKVAQQLKQVPLAGIVTTTLDHTLDEILPKDDTHLISVRSSVNYGSILRANEKFVLRLNDLRTDLLTMTSEHWSRAVEEAPELRTFLGSLLSTRTFFFIGTNPVNIEWFLEGVKYRPAEGTRHFALVPDQQGFEILAERYLAKYRIELIRFTPTDGYPEIPIFLDRLSSACAKRKPSIFRKAPPKSLMSARVSRLTLHNIGPFESAEFEFSKPWMVLLGNNGCGKSSVLKAIALALAGDDSEAIKYGTSILKVGAKSGSIRLNFGEAVYETTLRNDNGRVVVAVPQIPPLKAGLLLCLGFPSVRGVPSEGSATSKSESSSGPQVEDVLPLIKGGLDHRMSSIQEWIYASYVQSLDNNLPEGQRIGAEKTIENFFKILDDMVPGFNISFSRCDTKTEEVILSTSDGEIPMSFISQGMNSTIGWMGILIKRMFEVYGDLQDAREGHALVLIDEIDSHLHPEWQNILVPKIKTHFPKIQVIASTHSPLLVGNLDIGELVKFTRKGGEVTVQKIEQSFKDYRADQILTSSPFGLESTRSREWQKADKRFTELLQNPKRTSEENKEYLELSARFSQRPTQETDLGRNAEKLLNEFAKEKVSKLDLSEEERQNLIEEAQRYLSGSAQK